VGFYEPVLTDRPATNQRDLESRAKEAEYFSVSKNPWLWERAKTGLGGKERQVLSSLNLELKINLTSMLAEPLNPASPASTSAASAHQR
jgi:hypothetical protein